jgi:hypothetical protein
MKTHPIQKDKEAAKAHEGTRRIKNTSSVFLRVGAQRPSRAFAAK